MKSIKPGRGHSMMGGIASIAAGLFGVFWTISAVNMGAPWFFAAFGILFIVIAVVQAIYNIKNASGENRFSVYDIVDENEEGDPLQDYLKAKRNVKGIKEERPLSEDGQEIHFCPYCGVKVDSEFEFCSKCGKKLPE